MQLTAWWGSQTWKDGRFPCEKWHEGKGEAAVTVYDRGCGRDVRDGLPEDVTSQRRPVCGRGKGGMMSIPEKRLSY